MINNDSVIFVFYDLKENENWTYKKFPKNWTWTGAGYTGNSSYSREEQFNGPLKYREKMINILKDKFTELERKGIVIRFKIKDSYKA